MALSQSEQFDLLRAEMDRQGVTDNQIRAGIAAIAMGESALNPHTETDYSHTANSRIRVIFGSRVADLTEPQLNILKTNPVAFFNTVYGGAWGAKNLGNTSEGDGYKYRGRTVLQLTGRGNYQHVQNMTGYEIVDSPDLANDPKVSAAVAVAYMRWRYKKGGGWTAMKAAVGNNIPDIDDRKNAFFSQFMTTGEFNYTGGAPPVPATPAVVTFGPKEDRDPVIAAFYRASFDLQQFLGGKGKYTGALDSDWGPGSRSALAAYLNSRG